MAFNDIVNNPAFGKLYRGNTAFRGLFDRYKDTIFENSGLSSLMSKIKVHTNNQNGISFSYDPAGPSRFKAFEDVLDEAKFNRGLKSTRMYTAEAGSYSVGGYTNLLAQRIASSHPGHQVRVRSYEPAGLDDFRWMQDQMSGKNGELYGLRTYGSDGTFQVLDIMNVKGQRKTFQEVMDMAKITMTDQGAAAKRAKIFTNDRILAVDRDVSNSLKGLLFDPRTFIQNNPTMKAQAEATARIAAGPGASPKRYQDALNDVYNTMTDGMSFQTRSSFLNEMDENIKRGEKIKADAAANLKMAHPSSPEYAQFRKDLEDGQAIIDTAIHEKKMKGGTRNVRVANLQDASDPTGKTRIAFGKGDVNIIDDDKAAGMLKAMGIDARNVDLSQISIIMPRTDVKTELTYGLSSFKSLESHGIPHSAKSNLLTTVTYQDILDPNGYLVDGTKKEIAQHIEELKSGNISQGLRNVLDEMRNWAPLETEGPAAQQAAYEGRKFVSRIDKMLQNGQDLTADPMLTSEMFNAMSRHYTKYRKGRFGKTIEFGGAQVPYYEAGFVMQGSTRAHIISSISEQQTAVRRNELKFEGNAFRINGDDVFRMKAAFGGSDLDDELYASLRYDPEAKKLLAFTLRDPNEMGEYMIFEAHHSLDREAPEPIKQLWKDLETAQTIILDPKIESKYQAGNLRDMDAIRAQLDKYYSETVPNVSIRKLFQDGGDNPRLYAPKGYALNDLDQFYQGGFANSLRSSREVTGRGTVSTARKAMRQELAPQVSENPFGSIFKFMGHDYDEYHQTTGYFKKSQTIQDLLKKTKEVKAVSNESIRARDLLEQESRGLLGRDVNQASLIDEFIQTNLHKSTSREVSHFKKMLKENAFTHIDREVVIDAVVKTGDKGILDEVKNVITEDAGKMGKIIGEMQKFNTLPGEDATNFGLDPLLFRTRLANNADALQSFKQGYATSKGMKLEDVKDSHFLLSETDNKAYASQLMQSVIDIRSDLDEKQLEAVQEAARNRIENLAGITFTPQEMTNASKIVDTFQSDTQAIREMMNSSTPEKILHEMMQGRLSIDDVLDGNSSTLRALANLGITSPDEVERHLLAISKLTAENSLLNPSNKRDAFEILRTTGGDGNSIQDLYYRALQRQVDTPRVIDKIKSAKTPEELAEFFKEGEFFGKARHAYDVTERNSAVIDRLMEFSGTEGRTKYAPDIDTLLRGIWDTKQMKNPDYLNYARSVKDFFTAQPGREGEQFDRIIPTFQRAAPEALKAPGSKRLFQRNIADEAAEGVSKVSEYYKQMKRVDMDVFKDLMKEPTLRKGIIGAGLLAGFGLLHRMTKDPTPEDMQGPPLLPGDGPYDNVSDIDRGDVSSMYSSINGTNNGQSMIYSIQATGGFDPNRLSSGLQTVTGVPTRGAVHDTRRTLSPSKNAVQLMNELMGR